MNHENARLILHGLAENSTPDARKRALEIVMEERVIDTPRRDVTIPLSGNRDARLSLPSTLSDQDWAYLTAVLAVMRPGLVVDTPEPAEEAETHG